MPSLKIEICETPSDAPDYNLDKKFKTARLEKVIVVKNGTVEGNATLDLQFIDDEGNHFVAMTTARLIGVAVSACADLQS